MAQITLLGPDADNKPPNLADETPENGWSFRRIIVSINAMFDELYTLVSGISAAELGFIDGVTAGTAAASKALVTDANVGIGAFRESGRNLRKQAAPAAKTVSATLTAAEIMAGLITGNQGAAGAAAYTLPLATDLETALIAAFPGLQNDDSFDFNVINLSTVAAEDITITTNTGWTLVGSMLVIEEAAGNPAGSNGLFRVRRTGANAYTLYRIG